MSDKKIELRKEVWDFIESYSINTLYELSLDDMLTGGGGFIKEVKL